MLGKFAGALIGLALTRHWVGVVIGLAIGHAWDAGWLQRWWSNKRPPGAMFVPLFELAGLVARADGPVTEAKVAAVEGLIARMALDPRKRTQAIIHFDRGRHGEAPADAAIAALRAFATSDKALPLIWLDQLATIALADEGAALSAQTLLLRAAQAWGIEPAQCAAVFERRQRGEAALARVRAAGDPYAVLGIAQGASEDQAREAWRRRIARAHPDRSGAASADGAPAAAEINAAWDAIRQQRGWT